MAANYTDNNRVAWTYTDDGGNDWKISAKAVYVGGADAAAFGGSAAGANVLAIPGNFRPRRVKVLTAGGLARWPIAYDTTCALWATPGTVIHLDVNGATATCTSTNRRRGERSNRAGTDQAA